jgi:hypothetical protein
MKRYEPTGDMSVNGWMGIDPDGDYVKYEDVKELLEILESLLTLIDNKNYYNDEVINKARDVVSKLRRPE